MTGLVVAQSFDTPRFFSAPDGYTLAYRQRSPVTAEAEGALVLLHGAASNGTRWWHFTDHTRLDGHRLLAPDLRGHGDSIWRGPAGMDHWCEDLVALLDHVQVERAVVAGHCLGANLAAHFAARHPDRCAGVVLIEPMLSEALTGRMAWLRRLAPLLRAGAWLVARVNRIGLYRRRLRRVHLRELDAPVHAASSQEAASAPPALLQVHGSLRHDAGVLPLAQLLANFVELLRPLPLADIQAPVLVIQASGRRMTDAALTRRRMEAALGNAHFVELPSEHWIPTTHPDRLRAMIDEWVGGR